jgi:hypothetical protein
MIGTIRVECQAGAAEGEQYDDNRHCINLGLQLHILLTAE